MHRRFFIFLLVLTFIYCGYWMLGRMAIGRGLNQVETSLGDSLSYAERSVTGFPSRFDATWTEPRFFHAGARIEAPLFQLFTLSYRPDGAVAFMAAPLRIGIAGHEAVLDNADLRASLRIVPGADLTMKRATIAGEDMSLQIDGRRFGTAQHMLLALRRAKDDTQQVDLWAELERLSSPGSSGFSEITLDAALHLNAPLGLRRAAPLITGADLRALRIGAGSAHVTVTGQISAGADGRFNGALHLTGQDWQAVLDRAVGLGVLEAEIAQTWRDLGLRAGDAETLDIPMNVRGGRVFMGLWPIASLPRVQRQ